MKRLLHPEIEDWAYKIATEYYWIYQDYLANGVPSVVKGQRTKSSEHQVFRRVCFEMFAKLLYGDEAIADD